MRQANASRKAGIRYKNFMARYKRFQRKRKQGKGWAVEVIKRPKQLQSGLKLNRLW